MRKKYDLAVYIGRFQPFHNGHAKVLKRAFEEAEKVLILIGSSGTAISIKNPFTYSDRYNLISGYIADAGLSDRDYKIEPLPDQTYNDALWISSVQTKAGTYLHWPIAYRKSGPRVALIGLDKDPSTYYLNCFPQWDFISVEQTHGIDATQIRKVLFEAPDKINTLKHHVPKNVWDKLFIWQTHSFFEVLKEEYDFINNYKKSWSAAPYAPTFVTVDAVVVHSGHILVVERGSFPGRGLWALPGGFVNQEETLKAACIRELKEETKLKIPEKVLLANCVGPFVFDDPNRSLRGRTITHAFSFKFPQGELPAVKGSDDAKTAHWMPIAVFKHEQSSFYEDHWHIINYFVNQA